MSSLDVAISLQALDGSWEICGRDRVAHVDPESLNTTYSTWGSDTASFTLKRKAGDIWPDLSAFTPVEIEIGGVAVWSGRIKETPTTGGGDSQASVQCAGWHYHLEDDVFENTYVHTKLADWKDMRTMPNATLGTNNAFAGGQVTGEGGTIQLAFPNGTSQVAGTHVGVVLDMGEFSDTAKAISVDYTASGNHGNAYLYGRGATSPDITSWGAGITDAFVITNGAGVSGNVTGTLGSGYRYIQLFMWSGITATPGADVFFKMNGIRVYSNIAYEAGQRSALRASDVVKDATERATRFVTPLVAPQSLVAEILSDQPMHYWPLDESGGVTVADDYKTTIDSTATQLTHYNSPSTTAALNSDANLQQWAKAYTAGTSTYTGEPAASSGRTTYNSGSLECLIRTSDVTGTTQMICGKQYAFTIFMDANKIKVFDYAVGWRDSLYTINDGKVHHIIVTWVSGVANSMKIYIDGTLRLTSQITITAHTSRFTIGASDNAGAGYQFFTGTVDEVAVYNYVMNSALVLAHYNAALGRPFGRIQRTAFNIPEFSMEGNKTPKETIEAINAFHNYVARVEVDQTITFKPTPPSPLLEIGPWAGAEFNDASANSSEEIYNRAVGEGTGPDGLPVRIYRGAGQVSPNTDENVTNPVPLNPSFDTSALSWGYFGGTTLVRDTGIFQSSPASGKFSATSAVVIPNGSQLYTSYSGSEFFYPWLVYTVTWYDRVVTSGGNWTLNYRFGKISAGVGGLPPDYVESTIVDSTSGGAWVKKSLTWQPRTVYPSTDITFNFTKTDSVGIAPADSHYFIDTLNLTVRKPTLADRRSFVKTKILPVTAAVTTTSLTQIVNIYLESRKMTPLKGEMKVTGQNGIRTVIGGQSVAPHELGQNVGELVRLSNTIDPNAGHVGRDGQIASVAYDHSTRTATAAIDNTRDNFEAFLARLGVVTGQTAK